MNDIILGKITCPKCGTTYPTTGDPCPHCNPKPIDSCFVTPLKETVKVVCSGNGRIYEIDSNKTLEEFIEWFSEVYTKGMSGDE